MIEKFPDVGLERHYGTFGAQSRRLPVSVRICFPGRLFGDGKVRMRMRMSVWILIGDWG
jgi:hypothetical protein